MCGGGHASRYRTLSSGSPTPEHTLISYVKPPKLSVTWIVLYPWLRASQHEIDPGPGTTSVFPVLIQMPLPTASQNQTCAIVLMSGSFPFGS